MDLIELTDLEEEKRPFEVFKKLRDALRSDLATAAVRSKTYLASKRQQNKKVPMAPFFMSAVFPIPICLSPEDVV